MSPRLPTIWSCHLSPRLGNLIPTQREDRPINYAHIRFRKESRNVDMVIVRQRSASSKATCIVMGLLRIPSGLTTYSRGLGAAVFDQRNMPMSSSDNLQSTVNCQGEPPVGYILTLKKSFVKPISSSSSASSQQILRIFNVMNINIGIL